jgi:CRISPR-associated protein Csh2
MLLNLEFRDYLFKVLNKKIFMRPEFVSTESLALKQIKDLASGYVTGVDTKNPKIDRTRLLNEHIDIKLFGILFAVGDLHFKQIGPVQFSIGQSLNNVEEIQIRMTRVVPTKAGAESGTFGEKSVVRYSFIEFHGFVNNNVAKEIDLSEEDVKNMLAAIWKGTNSLSTSSKFGQQSRLLVKVNYKDDGYIGDLDQKCKLEADTDPLENISQIKLDTNKLFSILSKNKGIIDSVEYEDNAELICKSDEKESSFEELVKEWAGKNSIQASRLNL